MGLDREFSDNSPIDPEPSSAEAHQTEQSRGARMAPIPFAGDPGRLHRDLLPEFFRNGDGFGHYRDRNHVIGFRPHGFYGWRPFAPQIRKIQLVGLVVHPEPVVYQSGEMPTMAKLATIPLPIARRIQKNAASRGESAKRGGPVRRQGVVGTPHARPDPGHEDMRRMPRLRAGPSARGVLVSSGLVRLGGDSGRGPLPTGGVMIYVIVCICICLLVSAVLCRIAIHWSDRSRSNRFDREPARRLRRQCGVQRISRRSSFNASFSLCAPR